MKTNFFLLPRVGLTFQVLMFLTCSCQIGATGKAIRISPKLAEGDIRARLLIYTPLGSSSTEVLEFTRAHLRHTGPEPTYEQSPAVRTGVAQEQTVRVGVRSVNTCLGEYGFPGRSGTFVTWAFDGHDRLIDVIVEKWRDSL